MKGPLEIPVSEGSGKKFDGGKRPRVDKEFTMIVTGTAKPEDGRKVWMAGKTAKEDYENEY
jgi:hypothetical protein